MSSATQAEDLLAQRIAESAAATDGVATSMAEFRQWLADCQSRQAQHVRSIPLADLRGWYTEESTGNLRHASGRFFSVEGLRVRTDAGPVHEWSQPILHQPEIGILGIAVRSIGGVLHCLIQAKSEPGNINGVQLSPTVQATKSNYSQVHGGAAVPYLDCFRGPARGQVLADVLQSEQGSWFYRKRNRNMVVEVGPEVQAGTDFCWLTLGQLYRLMHVENLVNMDTRTVLSCFPSPEPDARPGLHSTVDVLSWITTKQTEIELDTELTPLAATPKWRRDSHAISHESGQFFAVVAVDVQTNSREVAGWTQPMIQPRAVGEIAMLVRRIDGVPHALMKARIEPGYRDKVELAPTVQCNPENYANLPQEPPLLDTVRRRRDSQVLFDTELSEEGGRFRHARARYQVIEFDEEVPDQWRQDFMWVSLPQLTGLLRHSHYVNVQARTLIAVLRGLW